MGAGIGGTGSRAGAGPRVLGCRSLAAWLAVAASLALAGSPAIARAQAPAGSTAPAGTTAPAGPAGPAGPPAGVPPTGGPGAPPGAADGTAAPAKPVVPATGYGWSTRSTPVRGRGRVRAVRAGTAASASPNGTVIPGFETLADGSSRVFVQLPKAASFMQNPKGAPKGSLVYVLKGVHVDRRNNLNSLVTVHFNTPVMSARLVPHGGDLWLSIALRARVQPTVAMDPTKDGGAMLRVEFPKGDYLSGAPVPDDANDAMAPAAPGTASRGAAAPAPTRAPAPASSVYSPSSL